MATDLRRVFARAAEILGGKEQLADHLQTDMAGLRKWATLAVEPPVHVLQLLAQILKQELLANHRLPRTPMKGARPGARGR